MFLTPVKNDCDYVKVIDNHIAGCAAIRSNDQIDTSAEYMIKFLNHLTSISKRVIFVGLFPRFWQTCCRDGSHFHVNFSPEDHLRLIRDLTPFLQRSKLLSGKVDVLSLQSLFGPSIFSGNWSLKDQVHVGRSAIRRVSLGLLELIRKPDSTPAGLFGRKQIENDVPFTKWHHDYLVNDSSCAPVDPGRNLCKILREAEEARGRAHSRDSHRQDRSASRTDSHNSGGNRRGSWSHRSRFSPYPDSSRGRFSDSSRGRFSESSRDRNQPPVKRDNRPGRNWSWS